MLMEDTMQMCAEYLTVAQREETVKHRTQTYHSLVLHGKLWTAVQWIIERETGGVLQPGDRCKKTGDRVMEVLRAKHLEARKPTAASLYSYPDRPLELTPVEITDNTVTAVAGQLLGGAGPGGTNSVLLQR